MYIILLAVLVGSMLFYNSKRKKKKMLDTTLEQPFPAAWRDTLAKRVLFYKQLDGTAQQVFEKRVRLFVATKSIRGIDTDVDDTVMVLVASSAIIPTFAFPGFNYPNVQTVLIYPNSFDEDFRTQRFNGHHEYITGIVGNQALNGTVILSKPDLLDSFSGHPTKGNVGIHEFVHLLDDEDGAIDGIPEVLIQQTFVGPWLAEIKKETDRIVRGKSDIDPYAMKSNAEFLAVVSEYFFSNPEKFQKRHPELYEKLAVIFNVQQYAPSKN